MQEYPIPYYVVEFLSEEWITWSTFSVIFIATPLYNECIINDRVYWRKFKKYS